MSRMKEIQPAAGILTPGPRSAQAAFRVFADRFKMRPVIPLPDVVGSGLAALRVFADRFKMPTPFLPDIAGSRLALMRAWKIERTPLVCAWERFAGPNTALGALRHGLAVLAERASIMAQPREVAAKG